VSAGATSAGTLYLLDTNILVTYMRAAALGQFIEATYRLMQIPNVPLISVVSRGEMLAFAVVNGWGSLRKTALMTLLNSLITVDINHNTIIDDYAEIDAFSRKSGHRMGKNDVWIAATAKATQAKLLTTDQDFDHLCPAHLIRDYIDPKTHQIMYG